MVEKAVSAFVRRLGGDNGIMQHNAVYHNATEVRMEPKARRVKPNHSITFKEEALRLATRHGVHVRIEQNGHDALVATFYHKLTK